MNLLQYMQNEFDVLDWPGLDYAQADICNNVKDVLWLLGKQGHSAESMQYVTFLIERLANFRPLSAIEDKTNEWKLLRTDNGIDTFYHERCPEVIKVMDRIIWTKGVIFERDGLRFYAGQHSHVPVELPWMWRLPEVRDASTIDF